LISLLNGGANPGQQAQTSQGTALHVAAAKGFADKCRLLLDAGGSRLLELRDGLGRAPIFSAVAGKHMHILELLHTEYGADLHTTDHRNATLLHSAASYGDVAAMDYLLLHGVDTNAVSSDGMTALSQAAGTGSVVAVQHLLQRGAEAASGTLHFAVNTGQLAVVQLLLRHGLSATTCIAEDGTTPLMAACATGNTAIAQLLLQHGADARAVRHCGDTALHAAVSLCCDRSESALRNEAASLLQHIKQVHAADRAPVLAADATAASVQCLQLLLDAGADVNAASASGVTALHMAAASCDGAAAVLLLLERGADTSMRRCDGATPLLIAASDGCARCVEALLDAGAQLSAVRGDGRTVLHAAACNEAPQVLQLLLERGAAAAVSIDAMAKGCDCCGASTALMLCTQPAQLKLLLAAGADAHKTTGRGSTSVHVAAAHARPASVLCLLIKAGVDVQAVDSRGRTAAKVAAAYGNALAASLLNRVVSGGA
jgi:ankyrin repeat protein